MTSIEGSRPGYFRPLVGASPGVTDGKVTIAPSGARAEVWDGQLFEVHVLVLFPCGVDAGLFDELRIANAAGRGLSSGVGSNHGRRRWRASNSR